jgi:hypothetical protein
MGTDDAEISEEARLLAERVRERAAAMPTAADLADMTADALTSRSEMSPAEIRRLAADALSKAQEVSFLLGRLAGILGDGGGEP